MDTLLQNAARTLLAFDDDHIPHARIIRGDCGGKSRGTASDDDKLLFHHNSPPVMR